MGLDPGETAGEFTGRTREDGRVEFKVGFCSFWIRADEEIILDSQPDPQFEPCIITYREYDDSLCFLHFYTCIEPVTHVLEESVDDYSLAWHFSPDGLKRLADGIYEILGG